MTTADGGERALGAPRFDVVLRGYDRRQVDEHVARLQRVLARMRADLDAARSQPFPVVGPPPGMGPGPMPPGGPQPGGRPRPTPRPRPGAPAESPDMIGSFTDRMQSILQAAEEEAAEIRAAARRDASAMHDSSRQESESLRTELSELHRQRDAVVAELTRLRGQLEGMLAAPTARFAVTPPASGGGAAGTPRPRPAERQAEAREGERAPRDEQPRPRPRPKPVSEASGSSDETTAVRRPDAGDLFRPADDEAPTARSVEPDRTMAVSTVQRSGDTESDEKSGPAGKNTPRDTPDTKSDSAAARPADGASETVRVSAVRPTPAPSEGGSTPRNGRSGQSDEGRGGAPSGDRSGSASAEAGARTDRSSSGSRSG
ncbi:hypothetical protein [Pseudonocardia sp. WMMC193]|uniref:hypothetical protein n=1 Tax=Pseudonocardia sp. WMMC193 TaxID=2911965 RepID=UPI001F3CC7E2|nr:hypothetical protein [Pseudonocardia sp. WMMC193]MCF7551578.1 hypothetical protein [Pseudonocardia sp. WMMC193]